MVDPGSYGPIDWENASPEEAVSVGLIVGRVTHWEKGIGKEFRERCERFFRQYRSFRQWWDEVTHGGNENDRDVLMHEAKQKWGARLHIPLSFRTIETIVPRAIANMPKLLYLPRDEQWIKNVETVRLLIDAQQSRINIDLPLQQVMRNGLIFGLGVGKTYWRHEERRRRRMEPDALTPSKFVLGEAKGEVEFDDPMFEDLDVFDFMWDPHGSDVRTCEWMVHRSWVSTRTVLERVESKAWDTPSAQKLTVEKIQALGPNDQRYTEIWAERMRASGFQTRDLSAPGEHPHEVLEFHDGERVMTVLDRQVLVQAAENPCGEMPFQIYRPTPVSKMLVGIGALEPIEQLNREMDTLRSQRRDKASLAIGTPYAFDEGAIDREDLEWAPNAAIPVNNASPKDALWPIPVQDVPGSGYEEESAILRDIESVSGLGDAMNNQPGGPEAGTATEATLTQAALGRRIALLSRRFEQEIVRPVAREFLALNQCMIRENRPALFVPGQDGSEGDPGAGEWRQFPVGPGELLGEYEIEPEGGSMEARNVPQDRSDAQAILQELSHDWYINPTKARLRAMELMGIKHPQSWLRAPEPSVPQAALRFLMEAGVDPSLLMQAVLRAREVTAPQEGPAASQITEMVGVEGTQ